METERLPECRICGHKIDRLSVLIAPSYCGICGDGMEGQEGVRNNFCCSACMDRMKTKK